MLYTNLKHIESASDYWQIIRMHTNLVICYGRMDLHSIAIYNIMEEVQAEYPHIAFYDLEFDNPEFEMVRTHYACNHKNDVPYVIYLQNATLIRITNGSQKKEDVTVILHELFNTQDNNSAEVV